MSAPNLRLPRSLVPDVVATARGVRITGSYYRALPTGYALDVALPRKPYPGYDSRGSVPGIVHGLYLASHPKTTMLEVWSPARDGWQKKDLYSVNVDVSNVFDLRDLAVMPWIERDCFHLGHAPSPEHRNYAAWHYVAYAIWSAGFRGIIWKSKRYAGDVLCVYDLDKGSFVRKGKLLHHAIRPDEWLKKNP